MCDFWIILFSFFGIRNQNPRLCANPQTISQNIDKFSPCEYRKTLGLLSLTKQKFEENKEVNYPNVKKTQKMV